MIKPVYDFNDEDGSQQWLEVAIGLCKFGYLSVGVNNVDTDTLEGRASAELALGADVDGGEGELTGATASDLRRDG